MDITSPRDRNPSPTTSPHSNGGSCTTSNGSSSVVLVATPSLTSSSNPIFRSNESNPYPTTFVQADTSSFKQVVQMLTGASETAKQASKTDPTATAAAPRGGSIPPIRSTGQKKQGFKLYERRNSLKNGLMINTLMSGFSVRKPEILSPSILDFPALVLSPATPLNEDNLSRSSPVAIGNSLEEDKAIAEKKFYFHPSPRAAAGTPEPQLLPLFPVTSPRVSGSSS
ncbi:VQ motif-containing protein [Dorcoceras hygrometricum]|uniref:VQ motif-containing protein n=1 Tax=Dorcoceras hygrometricum TaxID=472368 RepID=A0A2Z7AVH7_9LAMI|nr:VQ motif-containing protein [Dorcoceras hygrometricum]